MDLSFIILFMLSSVYYPLIYYFLLISSFSSTYCLSSLFICSILVVLGYILLWASCVSILRILCGGVGLASSVGRVWGDGRSQLESFIRPITALKLMLLSFPLFCFTPCLLFIYHLFLCFSCSLSFIASPQPGLGNRSLNFWMFTNCLMNIQLLSFDSFASSLSCARMCSWHFFKII